jgi:hypothetical protein
MYGAVQERLTCVAVMPVSRKVHQPKKYGKRSISKLSMITNSSTVARIVDLKEIL